MRRLYNAAAVYTGLGLVAGIYYREFTKAHAFTGETQLSVVHTHLFALGTLFLLIAMGLEKLFSLSRSHWFPLFFWTYQAGIVITTACFLVHGSLDVLGRTAGPAISGIAGLGHIGLTAGFLFFFLALRQQALPSDSGSTTTASAAGDASSITGG